MCVLSIVNYIAFAPYNQVFSLFTRHYLDRMGYKSSHLFHLRRLHYIFPRVSCNLMSKIFETSFHGCKFILACFLILKLKLLQILSYLIFIMFLLLKLSHKLFIGPQQLPYSSKTLNYSICVLMITSSFQSFLSFNRLKILYL